MNARGKVFSFLPAQSVGLVRYTLASHRRSVTVTTQCADNTTGSSLSVTCTSTGGWSGVNVILDIVQSMTITKCLIIVFYFFSLERINVCLSYIWQCNTVCTIDTCSKRNVFAVHAHSAINSQHLERTRFSTFTSL